MEEQIKDQSYYMIIPAHVWNADIKDKAKLLYGHITLLANKNGYCYASNKHLGKCVGVVKETASKLVSDLENLGVIRSVLIYKDGSKEVEQRKIYLATPQLMGINPDVNGPINQTVNSPINQMVKDNTTSNNSTSINNITDDERLLNKVIEKYPGNVGSKTPILKALKKLSTEEKKLTLINLDRYSKAWEGFHHNLRNYIEGKQFLDIELKKRESKSKPKDITNTKEFDTNY